MESEMVRKLKEILDNSTQEEFDKEWSAVLALGFQGPPIDDFIASFTAPKIFMPSTSASMFVNSGLEEFTYEELPSLVLAA